MIVPAQLLQPIAVTMIASVEKELPWCGSSLGTTEQLICTKRPTR